MATMVILRKGAKGTVAQESWDQPMTPMDYAQTQPVAAAPQVAADYTQFPGGGSYSTGAMGETIYNAADGTNWQMQADSSFIRIN